jgi:predicted transcriptional regulator
VRSQSEIEASILESCRTPNVQHWVMVKARLGYDTFWKHMNLLLSSGLMDERNDGSKTLYQTSAKGLEMLEKLSNLESAFTDFR